VAGSHPAHRLFGPSHSRTRPSTVRPARTGRFNAPAPPSARALTQRGFVGGHGYHARTPWIACKQGGAFGRLVRTRRAPGSVALSEASDQPIGRIFSSWRQSGLVFADGTLESTLRSSRGLGVVLRSSAKRTPVLRPPRSSHEALTGQSPADAGRAHAQAGGDGWGRQSPLKPRDKLNT
jgi:hypothetical protein